MKTVIRGADPADLPAVLELLAEAALPAAGVAEAFADFVVAEGEGGALLGAAGVELYGHDALLRSVVVAPAARGTGVGSRLVEAALEHAAARGCGAAYLLTTTAADWFPRHGFAPLERVSVPVAVQRSVEFTSACPASAAVMMRRLTPSRPAPVPGASAAAG
jgi:amino-acid N-acetyltransferase